MTLTLLTASCSKPAAPPPAVPSGPEAAAVGTASGRFVGSAACATCHAKEYAAWSDSRHRQTLRPFAPSQALLLASTALPAPYRAAKDGSVSGPGPDGKETFGQIAFLVGGHHREDAWVRLTDGRLQVFPISFDVDRGQPFEPLRELAGGTSPPSDVVDFWTRIGRNADIACYGCHATGQVVEIAGKSPSGLVLPGSKWVEPGVGCEGCHGPGGPHVDAAKAKQPASGLLKMTAADARSTTDACAACHGLRDVLPSPFGAAPAHHYGESIVAAAEPLLSISSNSEFRDPLFADLRPSTYQQEAIAFSQSGCARKGGMTCASCHDVHSALPAPALKAADGGNAICAPCHAPIVAVGSKHTLHPAGTPGSRCLDCHMAKVVRGPGHELDRDHSMAPPIAGPDQVPAACVSCHAGAKNASRIAEAWKRNVPGPAAKRRQEIVAAIDDDAAGRKSAPAALARLAGDPERGWFVRWAALQKLGMGRPAQVTGDAADAIRLAVSDPNPAVRRAAARALGILGAPNDAETLQHLTDDADPWTALEAARAMGQLGIPTAGARLLQLLKRPDLIAEARAQYVYGHACLVGQDMKHAESALRRALLLNPLMVGALNDLGLALVGLNQKDAAIAAWKHALDINPRFSAARRNLESAASK